MLLPSVTIGLGKGAIWLPSTPVASYSGEKNLKTWFSLDSRSDGEVLLSAFCLFYPLWMWTPSAAVEVEHPKLHKSWRDVPHKARRKEREPPPKNQFDKLLISCCTRLERANRALEIVPQPSGVFFEQNKNKTVTDIAGRLEKNCNTLTCVLLGRCCHMNSWSSSLKRRSVPHNCCVAACCTNTHEVLGFNFHVLYCITSRGGRALQPARDGDLNASQSAQSPRAAGKQTDRQTDPNTQRQRRNEFESQATSLLE